MKRIEMGGSIMAFLSVRVIFKFFVRYAHEWQYILVVISRQQHVSLAFEKAKNGKKGPLGNILELSR